MSHQVFVGSGGGDKQYPYISSDNGSTWNPVTSSDLPNYLIINCITGSIGGLVLAISANNGNIYISNNRGVNWTAIPLAGLGESSFMSSDGTKLIVFSNTGIYLLTYSGGTWSSPQNITPSGTTSWSSCTMSSDGNVFYVGANNTIYKSTNNGTSWTNNSTFSGATPNNNWWSIATNSNGNTVLLADFSGYLYISKNGGNTFIAETSPGTANWYSNCLAMTPNSQGLIAGAGNGYVWLGVYTGSTYTWTQQNQINMGSKNWLRVSCSSDFTVLGAAVNYGDVYISTNSGSSWIDQTTLGSAGWHGIVISADPVCVIGTTQILMADNTLKMIKDIQRGDLVLTNKDTNENKKVCRVVKSYYSGDVIKLKKKLIGNTDDLIMTSGHPIWVNNDTNRVCCRDLSGREIVKICDYFYNIQFEDEGTYYSESVKVDSLSSNNHERKLPKELYFDQSKYDEKCIIIEEDDPRRNKPPMINKY
jgi:hypothetical protein